MAYRPPYASERLLPKVDGSWTGCRISTTWHGYAVATLSESTRNAKHVVKGIRGRGRDLKRGWRGTGDTTRSGYNQGHVHDMAAGMFPDLPLPRLFDTREFSEVWSLLPEVAVSISVRLSALPATAPMRRWTSADHQVLVIDKRTRDGEQQGLIYDPMRPQGKYGGSWVPRADIRIAAQAILEGAFLTELYPVGAWTAEALMRRRKTIRIEAIEGAAAKTERRLRARIAALEVATPTDCAPVVAEARERALIEAAAASGIAIDALRTQP